MRIFSRWISFVVAALLVAVPPARAQAPDSAAALAGVVRTEEGEPVPNANVFLLETLEGVLTDADGRFVIPTRERAEVTLVVRSAGYGEVRRTIAPGERTGIVVVLEVEPVEFSPIDVRAGRYTIEEGFHATLSPLDIVTTPGTAADIARALQTLPGVQGLNEGNALFVRGGDYTETKLLLNDATLLNSRQTRYPMGTFIGTVDPFLLDGIYFSSGGFGARYGNALSAVASLETTGMPERSSVTAGAGLSAVSAAVDVAAPADIGLHFRTNAFDMSPLFAVNGAPRDFEDAPAGRDLSASAVWRYRPTGELKIFAIDQQLNYKLDGIGVLLQPYDLEYGSDLVVATHRDVFGDFSSNISLSYGSHERSEVFPAAQFGQAQDSKQVFAQVGWSPHERVRMHVGGILDHRFHALKDNPTFDADTFPDDFAPVYGENTSTRTGAFTEVDLRPTARTRLIAGLRTDYSSLTQTQTVDPRISAAFRPRPWATITAAWGIYHQVADPLDYHRQFGSPDLPTMRARQAVLGLQLDDADGQMARVEIYDKRYTNLVQQTEFDFAIVGRGEGRSRGVDVFLKGRGPWGIDGRVTYSYVSARRTYPGTGEMARAAFDVPHTLTFVLNRTWLDRLLTSIAYRFATGAPYTSVDPDQVEYHDYHWHPIVTEPRDARLPSWRRLDFSVSYASQPSPSVELVGYVQLTNVWGQDNFWRYAYSSDYSAGSMIPSVFSRSIYVGASLKWSDR